MGWRREALQLCRLSYWLHVSVIIQIPAEMAIGNGHAGGLRSSKAPDLVSLAANIAEKTTQMSEYLTREGHAEPNFEPNSGDPPESAEYLALHSSLTASLEDLQRLIDGPRRNLRERYIMVGNDLAALQVAFDFNFFQLMPIERAIRTDDLSRAACAC